MEHKITLALLIDFFAIYHLSIYPSILFILKWTIKNVFWMTGRKPAKKGNVHQKNQYLTIPITPLIFIFQIYNQLHS